MPALGLLDQVQIGDTGPAESTRRGNLQRVGLLFLGSPDSVLQYIPVEIFRASFKFFMGDTLKGQ